MRRGSLSAYVAEDDCCLVGRVFEEVVEISADCAGRQKADRKFSVLVHGRSGGQQAELHFASHGNVALELLLLAFHGLVEPGVFDGDGDLRGHRGRVRT